MTKKFTPSSFLMLGLSVSILTLSACGGGSQTQKPEISSSMNPSLRTSAIDRAMEKALAQAEANGSSQEVLAMLAQVHGRNPDDAIVATRYSRALREDDQINAAIRTLTPFTNGADKNIEATTEMAMAQIALGDFSAAETFAQRSTEMNAKNARAYLALGTAQDALGRHQDAEISFREGLKHWKGDPTPILNNLALNLASQGHLEESLSLLEKALKISPNRMDLERNRRIIATLLETTGPRAPAPSTKPEADKNKIADTVVKKDPVPTKKPTKAKETTPEKVEAEPQKTATKEKKKAPTPPPQKEEIKESAVKEVPEKTDAIDVTSPKTTLKNIGLKKKDSYN